MGPYHAVHGCSGCATTGGAMACPWHGPSATRQAEPSPGVGVVMQLQAMTDGAQLCALGNHAWMPWLAIQNDEGTILRYVTYCVRCRHPEQYDL